MSIAAAERRVVRLAFRPPPRQTVTEWADAHRYLSPESSAEPGPYTSSRAPYQRGPMDALSDPRVRQVVLMWPSQVGKTEILNNFIGKRIHLEPGPMLVLQPTLQMGEAWSKDRLAPMLRDTPALRGKVKDARSRDSDNTLLHKKFPGGHLTIAGANSPAGLASRPIRDVLCDEVDRYPASAGSEGDPVGLAFRRAATFRNGKRLLISSPTVKGRSRIEKEFAESTQEMWWVPCPHCHEMQMLLFGGRDIAFGIKWEQGQPDTAHYLCAHCAVVIEEMWKGWMNARGEWRAENPGHPVRGFWLNAWNSPWAAWRDLVREWLSVKGDPIRRRQFVNTVLCETWEDHGESIEAHVLAERIEAYQPRVPDTDPPIADRSIVPAGAGLIVRTTDTQGDRLESVVWAFGAGEEAWLVDFDMLPGSPAIPPGQPGSPWDMHDDLLRREYRHAVSGAVVPLAVTFIDSGGHHASDVYAYTKARNVRRVYAIKGLAEQEGAPIVGKVTRNNNAKAILVPVGSFTAKEAVLARMTKVKEPGPGYIHLPDWLDSEQLSQLTRTRIVERPVLGRTKRLIVEQGRVEQLHLLAYALAAVRFRLGVLSDRQLTLLAAQHGSPPPQDPPANEQPSAVPPRRPPPSPGGFVTGGGRWGRWGQ